VGKRQPAPALNLTGESLPAAAEAAAGFWELLPMGPAQGIAAMADMSAGVGGLLVDREARVAGRVWVLDEKVDAYRVRGAWRSRGCAAM